MAADTMPSGRVSTRCQTTRFDRERTRLTPRQLTSSQKEMDRLDLIHHLMIKGVGDKHFLSPIPESKLKRILDIGTGTGIWAIEMGDMYPGAEVIGNDLSPIQPEWCVLVFQIVAKQAFLTSTGCHRTSNSRLTTSRVPGYMQSRSI
jgi:SAM-dependent methyltransferase